MTEVTDELTALLADEHAAIYAYGVLGARLDAREQPLARSASTGHRAARDEVRARLQRLGADAPGPAAAYEIVVGTATQARASALRVEEQLCVRWRDLIGTTDDPDLRALAVQGLQDCAVRASRWRRASGVTPTVAFPGKT